MNHRLAEGRPYKKKRSSVVGRVAEKAKVMFRTQLLEQPSVRSGGAQHIPPLEIKSGDSRASCHKKNIPLRTRDTWPPFVVIWLYPCVSFNTHKWLLIGMQTQAQFVSHGGAFVPI